MWIFDGVFNWSVTLWGYTRVGCAVAPLDRSGGIITTIPRRRLSVVLSLNDY
jgi:hypothetical protein